MPSTKYAGFLLKWLNFTQGNDKGKCKKQVLVEWSDFFFFFGLQSLISQKTVSNLSFVCMHGFVISLSMAETVSNMKMQLSSGHSSWWGSSKSVLSPTKSSLLLFLVCSVFCNMVLNLLNLTSMTSQQATSPLFSLGLLTVSRKHIFSHLPLTSFSCLLTCSKTSLLQEPSQIQIFMKMVLTDTAFVVLKAHSLCSHGSELCLLLGLVPWLSLSHVYLWD